MATTLTKIPQCVLGGTTVTYERTVDDYPADDGWTMTLHLRGKDVLDVTGVASGAVHTITIPATSTTKLRAGGYQWVERVTKSGVVHAVGSGRIEVQADPLTLGAGAGASMNEKLLELVEARLEGRLSSGDGLEQYTFHGRSVVYMQLDQLLEARAKLKRLVWQERNPGRTGPNVRYTFTDLASEGSS